MNVQLTNADIVQLLKLWKRLFGTKMNESNWDFDTVTIWTIALNDLQMTPIEFETAQRKSLTLSWPPTAPADFLELGRGSIADNYPDMHKAYIDAAHHRWDEDGILYETAKRVGLAAMRELAEVKTYPQWQKHYPDVCKLHSQGLLAKPAPVKAIEQKSSKPCSQDVADYYLNKIRALLAERDNDNNK